jgi:hypothetical protein
VNWKRDCCPLCASAGHSWEPGECLVCATDLQESQ